jgi:hypothetical protein
MPSAKGLKLKTLNLACLEPCFKDNVKLRFGADLSSPQQITGTSGPETRLAYLTDSHVNSRVHGWDTRPHALIVRYASPGTD